MSWHHRLADTAIASVRCALGAFESPYPNDVVYGFVLSCPYETMEPQSCFFTQEGLRATLERTLGDVEAGVHPRTWSAAKQSLLLSPPDSEFDQLLDERCLSELQRHVRSAPSTAEVESVIPDALERALVACRDLGLGVRIACNVFVVDDVEGNTARLQRLNEPILLARLGLIRPANSESHS